MNASRQLYRTSFGSTQRPPSPGFLATNDVKCTYALRGPLLDRGIELPQERDMAVRMIDVPTAGRARDRGEIDRYCLRTVEAASGIPATLCPEIQNKTALSFDLPGKYRDLPGYYRISYRLQAGRGSWRLPSKNYRLVLVDTIPPAYRPLPPSNNIYRRRIVLPVGGRRQRGRRRTDRRRLVLRRLVL